MAIIPPVSPSCTPTCTCANITKQSPITYPHLPERFHALYFVYRLQATDYRLQTTHPRNRLCIGVHLTFSSSTFQFSLLQTPPTLGTWKHPLTIIDARDPRLGCPGVVHAWPCTALIPLHRATSLCASLPRKGYCTEYSSTVFQVHLSSIHRYFRDRLHVRDTMASPPTEYTNIAFATHVQDWSRIGLVREADGEVQSRRLDEDEG